MLKEHSSVVDEVGETSSSHEKVINILFSSCCKPLKSYKKEENVKTRETKEKCKYMMVFNDPHIMPSRH